MKWPLIVITMLTLSMAACSPPKPPCCKNIGLGLHPVNPEMMSEEQLKAGSNP